MLALGKTEKDVDNGEPVKTKPFLPLMVGLGRNLVETTASGLAGLAWLFIVLSPPFIAAAPGGAGDDVAAAGEAEAAKRGTGVLRGSKLEAEELVTSSFLAKFVSLRIKKQFLL